MDITRLSVLSRLCSTASLYLMEAQITVQELLRRHNFKIIEISLLREEKLQLYL